MIQAADAINDTSWGLCHAQTKGHIAVNRVCISLLDAEQDGGVDEGDTGGHPVEILPAGQAETDEGEDEGEDVDEFVAGVGDESEGVVKIADHDLEDDETGVEGDGDAVCVPGGFVPGHVHRVGMMGVRRHGLQRSWIKVSTRLTRMFAIVPNPI